MSAEREDSNSKRPFKDTQEVYRTAYETLVGPLLEAPDSPLSRKIAVEQNRLMAHLQKVEDREETESQAQKGNEVIAFNLEGLSVPVALPVDYRGRKRAPENRHNIAQIYFFGDKSLEEIGGFYKLTRARVHQQVEAATCQMLRAVPQAGLPLEKLNFRRPLSDRLRDKLSLARGGVTVGIMEALKGGATYDEGNRVRR